MKTSLNDVYKWSFFHKFKLDLFSLNSISSLVIPANYNPLITPLITHPTGPAPIVNKVFKTKLNILFKIVVKLFESNISSILSYISIKSSYYLVSIYY